MAEKFTPIPTADLTPYTPVSTTEAGPIKRLLAASICAGSALMPVQSAEAEAPVPNYAAVQLTTIHLPPMGHYVCPPVTPEALAAVDTLLAQPEDPGAMKVQPEKATDPSGLPSLIVPKPLTARERKHNLWEIRASMANRTRQTMYDPAPFTEKLVEPLQNPFIPPLPFSEYMHTAEAFGHKYGVTFRLADGGDTSLVHDGFYPHSATNEGVLARQGVVDAIEHLGNLTKEYVDLTGVEEIVFYDKHSSKWAGFAIYSKRQVALPIGDEPIYEQVFDHEFGHHQVNTTCGGAQQDPQFDAPGHGNFSPGDASEASRPVYDRLYAAMDRHDYEAACQADQEIQEIDQQVGAITAYGETDPGENKADIIAKFGSQDLYSNAFDPTASEALRQRGRLMLGRLYMASKNIATYFIKLMPREQSFNNLAQACRTGNFSQWNSSNNGMK